MISILLELGAMVDPRDSEGMTPLSYAVACENEKEIQLLVSAGHYVQGAGKPSIRTPVILLLVFPHVGLGHFLASRSRVPASIFGGI